MTFSPHNYITISCPVRLSIIGGSSDLSQYLQRHGKGSVISFTPSLYTYVSVYRDVLGRNNLDRKYIVNYSEREEVDSIANIRNELVRMCLAENSCVPCSVHMTSDVFSYGSGLAVSSSYTCSLMMAIHESMGKSISQFECGIKSNALEKHINPLVGQQDVYGCCVGGFKKIEFSESKNPSYTFLPTNIFEAYDVYLLYTGLVRNSTEVLKTVVVPEEDVFNPMVDEAERYIMKEEYSSFMRLVRDGWDSKKRTSSSILQSSVLVEMDEWLSSLKGCVAHKLCGAGNGGFFMCFFEKGNDPMDSRFYKVNLSPHGVRRLI